MIKRLLAVLVGAATMMCASQAAAEGGYVTPPCGIANQPCNYDPSLGVVYNMDYSVPTDGTTQQWDFWLANDDPGATLSLQPPNETFTYATYSDGTWAFQDGPSFEWAPTSTPGHLSIIVKGPTSWNYCGNPGITGLCGLSYSVWGNGTSLLIQSSKPGLISWSVRTVAVPEPATWSMMLLGFFGLGAAMRAKRERGLA